MTLNNPSSQLPVRVTLLECLLETGVKGKSFQNNNGAVYRVEGIKVLEIAKEKGSPWSQYREREVIAKEIMLAVKYKQYKQRKNAYDEINPCYHLEDIMVGT